MNISILEKLVREDMKKHGYLFSKSVKDKTKVYCQTWIGDNDKSIVIIVLNSHNDYRPQQLLQYTTLAKILIDEKYEISMRYPCTIRVTGSNDINKEIS
jgi:hypothetical protein